MEIEDNHVNGHLNGRHYYKEYAEVMKYNN
jgi:hypothetical protein